MFLYIPFKIHTLHGIFGRLCSFNPISRHPTAEIKEFLCTSFFGDGDGTNQEGGTYWTRNGVVEVCFACKYLHTNIVMSVNLFTHYVQRRLGNIPFPYRLTGVARGREPNGGNGEARRCRLLACRRTMNIIISAVMKQFLLRDCGRF